MVVPLSDDIKQFILSKLEKHPRDIAQLTMQKFHVTRTTVHRHLKSLLNGGKIIKRGETKNTQYFLAPSNYREKQYQTSKMGDEYSILRNDFIDIFDELSTQVQDIIEYGFTEMLNNAIDHAQAKKICIKVHMENNKIQMEVIDDGIGVFKTIMDRFQFSNIRDSILELNKGKLTIDPSNHTGEGIFFSSRSFDQFSIYANDYLYLRDNEENDWTLCALNKSQKGSRIVMSIGLNSTRTLVSVFQKFQDPETLAFDRTEITVELAKFQQETLISRSQAKRILRGLDRFNQVTLDFKGVRLVGQGFVDEVFRVYKNKNPQLTIHYINANEDVTFMIKRGLATG